MLTRKQSELLLFLEERISKSGVTPSFEEMKDKVGLKSKSGIHRLISALEDRGFIKKLPFKARAIEILKLPNIKQRPLDEKTEKNVVNSIQSIDSEKTVLIIAHRLSTIKNADRIFCVENGDILIFNSYAEYEKKKLSNL